ncbi:MAG: recombinase family protein, partial [Desulfobulbus sp.]|nr:recombinase family protein [Desulfobulbus sp.]
MQASPRVTMIPPTVRMHSAIPLSVTARRRVCGYARVSTDNEEQLGSYEAQMEYYEKFIREHEGWEYVGLYSDEGISGTSIRHRKGFQKMISDALAGKIDLIVTKSISRFARNTVDSISTVRQLKEKGVEVHFEKDGLWTFDPAAELTISILSSIAQEESRNLSQNVTWGQRARFADGKVTMPFRHFLGFDRGEDGSPVVNEEQAELVRRIYRMFVDGATVSGIAKVLTAESVPTPAGRQKWQPGVVESILTNEKYKGDALLQKSFCTDYLTKKMKKNEGEVPQYYV